MQFIIKELRKNGLHYVCLEHDGEVDQWSIEAYNKTKIQQHELLFKNINGFIAQLSDDHQQKIWGVYQTIKKLFDEVEDSLRLHQLLQKQVKFLYNVIKFKDVSKWVKLHGWVDIPADLKYDYSNIECELTKKLTYIRDDYYDLTILSIMLKPMAPIFGECIKRFSKDKGTKFKENYAFSLLSSSEITSITAFNRLKTYVEASVEKEESKNPKAIKKNSAIFGGLGSTELPDWLLSRVLVRRLAVHEENSGDSIIANIFYTLTQQIGSLDKTFNGAVREKRLDGGRSEEDNASVAENYKIKQPISDGDLAVLSVYTQRPLEMAVKVDPTINLDKVNTCINNANSNLDLIVNKFHIVLSQWVLSKAITPRGIPLLSKTSLIMAMGVTQALLWHWGLYELALLVTSEATVGVSSGASSPTTRLNKKYMGQFTDIYPHYQRTSNSLQNLRSSNVACKAIDKISAGLIQCDWINHAPIELMNEVGVKDDNALYMVSAEIRHQLGDLVLKINEMKKLNSNSVV